MQRATALLRPVFETRRNAMKIAVEGCCHGELDNIYASIERTEIEGNFKTDILLLCGDFQSVRNRSDLECLAVPQKYRRLGGFHQYYSGEKVAPLLTVVIGGNHEASNYMWELYYGGWLAPNIYFLGEAGAVDVGGVRIAGVSGIYKKHDYHCGRFEKMPYDKSEIRSVYHTRVYDIFRLKLLDHPFSRPDIVMSHDWPNTIEQHGDTAALKRKKPYFKDEIDKSTLGSPPLLDLLQTLKPKYWFSAHLHVKFAALFKHGGQSTCIHGADRYRVRRRQKSSSQSVLQSLPENSEALDLDPVGDTESDVGVTGVGARQAYGAAENPEEIDIDDIEEGPHGSMKIGADQPVHLGENESASQAREASSEARISGDQPLTRFLALSKCLPGQDFLQFIDVEAPEFDAAVSTSSLGLSRPRPSLRFNSRWLAIIRATHHLLTLKREQAHLPRTDDAELLRQIEKEEEWVQSHLLSVERECPQGKGKHVASLGGDTRPQLGSITNVASGGEPAEATNAKTTDDADALSVERIQGFVKTAPSASEPGGSAPGPPKWYTNPQTEALCRWLEIDNKINPPPEPLGHPRHTGHLGSAGACMPSTLQDGIQTGRSMVGSLMVARPATGIDGFAPSNGSVEAEAEAQEMRRIEESAQQAREARSTKRHKVDKYEFQAETREVERGIEPLRLDDEEDESHAQWKEGTG